MTAFLNIDFGQPIQLKFLFKNILYTVIWVVGIMTFIFRFDLFLFDYLPNDLHWIIKAIPFAFIGIVIIIMILSKWYYNLVLVFYPLLVIFWFLPKFILANGKIYLFSNYLSSIINTFKKFKKRIIQLFVFIVTLFLLIITDSMYIRILSLLVFSYFYLKYVYNYIQKSFSPPKLFGADIEKSIDDIISSSDKGMFLINAIEDQKQDEKLSSDEAKQKKIERLILLNFFIFNFRENLSGFNGKKAFVLSWIYQLVCFFIGTLIFFTFINFELFLIDKHNFLIVGNPSVFDFFYYTIKTITFNGIESIIPSSVFARIFEIVSYITLGVFLLIIVTSVIFSLRQDRLSENIKKATDLCIQQNEIIDKYIKTKYQTDIQTIINESKNIKSSIVNIKKVIDQLF
jgi:hypothetical protein